MKEPTPILHENLPIIEVAHSLLLDMIMTDKKTRPYIVKRLSKQVAIVAPGQFNKLVQRVRKMGHLPKVLEG